MNCHELCSAGHHSHFLGLWYSDRINLHLAGLLYEFQASTWHGSCAGPIEDMINLANFILQEVHELKGRSSKRTATCDHGNVRRHQGSEVPSVRTQSTGSVGTPGAPVRRLASRAGGSLLKIGPGPPPKVASHPNLLVLKLLAAADMAPLKLLPGVTPRPKAGLLLEMLLATPPKHAVSGNLLLPGLTLPPDPQMLFVTSRNSLPAPRLQLDVVPSVQCTSQRAGMQTCIAVE